MSANENPAALLAHGASQLSAVTVDAYNEELRQGEEFVGDRASRRAFQAILDDWRARIAKASADPLGESPTADLSRKQLDKILTEGAPEAAGLVHLAIEEFSNELAGVIRRFLRLKEWKDTERIIVSGGMRESRVGEICIGRTDVLLKSEGYAIELCAIRHHPDEAGLIGALHLVPAWMLAGHDSIVAIDIGGSNIRAGIVQVETGAVDSLELWRHGAEDPPPKREEAVEHLVGMLKDLIKRAKKDGRKLAPFIGIGCPGVIAPDGSIERGGQNLPGNWESKSFNLPQRLREAIPRVGDHETVIVMHNDAVLHGLSEAPDMRDVTRWGVLTIGTGLGNARFTNREPRKRAKER